MDVLLVFFIILAAGCVIYSVLAFKRKLIVTSHSDGWAFRKEDDHIFFSYKNVSFSGDCNYDGEGDGLDRRYVVKSIHIHLKSHPSKLSGWTKNDLYTIEQRILTQFPESDVVWEAPMSTLTNEEI